MAVLLQFFVYFVHSPPSKFTYHNSFAPQPTLWGHTIFNVQGSSIGQLFWCLFTRFSTSSCGWIQSRSFLNNESVAGRHFQMINGIKFCIFRRLTILITLSRAEGMRSRLLADWKRFCQSGHFMRTISAGISGSISPRCHKCEKVEHFLGGDSTGLPAGRRFLPGNKGICKQFRKYSLLSLSNFL